MSKNSGQEDATGRYGREHPGSAALDAASGILGPLVGPPSIPAGYVFGEEWESLTDDARNAALTAAAETLSLLAARITARRERMFEGAYANSRKEARTAEKKIDKVKPRQGPSYRKSSRTSYTGVSPLASSALLAFAEKLVQSSPQISASRFRSASTVDGNR